MITQRRRAGLAEDVQAKQNMQMHKMTGNELSPRYPAGWRIYSTVRWIGVAAFLLSLVPMLLGMLHFEGLMRPRNLALRHFDSLFRRFGTLFPFLPLVLRGVGTWKHSAWTSTHCPNTRVFRLWDTLWIYAGCQFLRLFVYLSHLIVQERHLAGEQLMSDHAVLALSVMACLTVEVAVTSHLAVAAARSRGGSVLFHVAAFLAWALLMLTSLDMYDTTRYFHHLEDSFTAFIIGSCIFGVLAIGLLLVPWRPTASDNERSSDLTDGIELSSQGE